MKKNVNDGTHDFSHESTYIQPQESAVRHALEKFQDKKIGLMMHWSPACQLGIFESWCMSDDSARWSRSCIDWHDDMKNFRREYRDAYTSFNPVRFQPDVWADYAEKNGFKYVLFTTKHHDGFCMWDTKTTDYKITNSRCPFSSHRYADVCRSVFDAFRKKGLAVHAYFSKPDWHTPYFWSKGIDVECTKRNADYDVEKNPELWQRFVDFTHAQIRELLTQYGKIDCLWLDGGWVRPDNLHQDIQLEKIISEIRKSSQPHLMVCDRTVGGVYENIITPEQAIPEEAMLVPWEACITLGNYFSYHYDDAYKPVRTLIHLIIDTICKGGNIALNITPQPDGRLPAEALKRLTAIGEFLSKYGEAIYGTRPCKPYKEGNMCFTQLGSKTYLFLLYNNETECPVQKITLPKDMHFSTAVSLSDCESVSVERRDGSTVLTIQSRFWAESPYCEVFCLE